MAVEDDLRAIGERANRDLDAVHDFFEHSTTVWDSFQKLVATGHRVVCQNHATGTTVDQGGLIALAPRYVREYLLPFGNRLRRRNLQAREYYLGHGLAIRIDVGFTSGLGGDHTEAETMFSLHWYVTEATVLHIGYDLFRQRLLHSGTTVW